MLKNHDNKKGATMSKQLSPEIRNYFASLGAKGGKTSGEKKARPAEHYKKIAALSVAARAKKRKEATT
jgi:hypothetical protein